MAFWNRKKPDPPAPQWLITIQKSWEQFREDDLPTFNSLGCVFLLQRLAAAAEKAEVLDATARRQYVRVSLQTQEDVLNDGFGKQARMSGPPASQLLDGLQVLVENLPVAWLESELDACMATAAKGVREVLNYK